MQSMYMAVGFSPTNELGCVKVTVVLSADKSLFKLFSFFLWQVLLVLILSKSFPSDVSININRTRPINRAGSKWKSAIDETQFVCLNFNLLASNPKTSENRVTKTCSTNFHLCTMSPSHTQGQNTAFLLSSPPAPPAAHWHVP